MAVFGTALASLVLAAIPHHDSIRTISIIYLFVVIWLAATYGRGPAITASLLAFAAYDFLFIPPLYVFNVNDSSEWISLLALLATSLVIGQLTAALQARTREAEASQRRAETLYALAQLVVQTYDQEKLYHELLARTVKEFSGQGVAACVLLVPDEQMEFTSVAAAPRNEPLLSALSLGLRENAGKVAWVFEHASPVGGAVPLGKEQFGERLRYYLPLVAGGHVIGVLGIVGTAEIRQLARAVTPLPNGDQAAPAAKSQTAEQNDISPQADLFAAFCSQIALALERAALQFRAIHTEALIESDRLKNTLLGSVTHDLRTPLASIKAAATSLLQPNVEWSEADRNELLTLIDTSADRLNRLVGNLLDLSRMEAGAAKPVKDWYLINDVIATVLDRLDLTGVTKDHHIVVAAEHDLPLAPFDYGQIEQVLTNLIENAVKYSPAGSEIRIEAAVHGASELEVRVRDHGIGIPSGELDAIFDKFYRIQQVRLPWQTQRPPLGTGLGLAICRSIISAHNGRIWAESEPENGSTFIFTLPIPKDRPRGKLPELAAPPEALSTDEQPAEALPSAPREVTG